MAKKQPKQKEKDFFCLVVENELTTFDVIREYKFHPTRKWRFDYAIVELKIAIEVEGGVWTGGRHTSSTGFISDIEKYNNATLLGWSLLRTTPDKLDSTEFYEILKELIQTKLHELYTKSDI